MAWEPKDPWGRKNDPLDDVLRQAQDQFKQLMPLRGGRTLFLVLLVVLMVWQGTFIVAPDEEGVVKRFGAVVRNVGPGPHLKIPFIESVLQPKVKKLLRKEVGFRTDSRGRHQMLPREALMLTGDENIVGVEFNVQYRINVAQNYLFNVDDIDQTIQKSAEASMREVIGKTPIDEVLTTGKAKFKPRRKISCRESWTIMEQAFRFKRSSCRMLIRPKQLPPRLKMSPAQKKIARSSLTNLKDYRNDIIPRAKGEAAQIVNKAKGFSQARVNRAEGEAKRFTQTLKEYSQAKDVISKRIYIETMEKILPRMEKIIIDGKISERTLPYLPLDRLRQTRSSSKGN